MGTDKCGIYEIRCAHSGKSYVGSSKHIYRRWSAHRYSLRSGLHRSPRLQQAWNKHGEAQFIFAILEECAPDDLLIREQHWIDREKRDYNSMPKVRQFTKEMVAKRLAKLRLRAAAITHCPKGHEYTPENTHISNAGKRICRRCNADRSARVRATESPEQIERRRQWFHEHHMKNRDKRIAQMRESYSRRKQS